MGSYCDLHLGAVTLGSSKNHYDPYLLSLFQESDKRLVETTLGECDVYVASEDDQDEPITLIQYACSVAVLRDRLEIMGITRRVAEHGFERGRDNEIRKWEEWGGMRRGEFAIERLNFLRTLTLNAWLSALAEIQSRRLRPVTGWDDEFRMLSPEVQYALQEDWYGFPGDEFRHFLRLLIENYPDDQELVYDFTDLVSGGWVDEADDLVDLLDKEVSADYFAERRSIVLTEGSTDARILDRSINLLYPHISDFFRFMDFGGANVGGGAGALANMVKAFVGAGILNRIIALFDNDTAAKVAMRSLNDLDLPNHVVVAAYPDLELGKSYPTIGPSGLVEMDVNGMAGSVELYLGEDCLRDDSGALIPIRWGGFDNTLDKYQGEITRKRLVRERFFRKLSECEADRSMIDKYDWGGVRLIIDSLRCAFREREAKVATA